LKVGVLGVAIGKAVFGILVPDDVIVLAGAQQREEVGADLEDLVHRAKWPRKMIRAARRQFPLPTLTDGAALPGKIEIPSSPPLEARMFRLPQARRRLRSTQYPPFRIRPFLGLHGAVTLPPAAGRLQSRRQGNCYGFRTFPVIELALYYALGKLPEPNVAHRFY
jgi:hypothetical protein